MTPDDDDDDCDLLPPDQWQGPLVLQQWVQNACGCPYAWVDSPQRAATAAEAESMALALCDDEARWNPAQHAITRLVRVVFPRHSVSARPDEPAIDYYHRTRGNLLLMYSPKRFTRIQEKMAE